MQPTPRHIAHLNTLHSIVVIPDIRWGNANWEPWKRLMLTCKNWAKSMSIIHEAADHFTDSLFSLYVGQIYSIKSNEIQSKELRVLQAYLQQMLSIAREINAPLTKYFHPDPTLKISAPSTTNMRAIGKFSWLSHHRPLIPVSYRYEIWSSSSPTLRTAIPISREISHNSWLICWLNTIKF